MSGFLPWLKVDSEIRRETGPFEEKKSQPVSQKSGAEYSQWGQNGGRPFTGGGGERETTRKSIRE
jgi:hypothetical protein